AVVVLSYPELKPVETVLFRGEINFPYVPGFLSFREAPLVLKAFERLTKSPDLVMVDGQGLAHPRRLGIASHLGLLLNLPTIGCAKSWLCGEYEVPPESAGSFTPLLDRGEVIGTVLRSRTGVKPLFVSVGHKIKLESATRWVLRCCCGLRLPEPTRLAHLAAGGKLREAVLYQQS
ncbi:MAG: deoxyribonuclease V, partial [Chloroflexota bacterium]